MSFTIILNSKRKSITENLRVFFFNELWLCPSSLTLTMRVAKEKKVKIAERGFDPRTSGLWAQHASTAPLCFACLWVVFLLLRLVRVPRWLCESAKVGMIGTQGTFQVKWWWLTVALESRWYMEDLKPLSTLPFNNTFYKTVIHVSSTIPMQQVTATPSVLAFNKCDWCYAAPNFGLGRRGILDTKAK